MQYPSSVAEVSRLHSLASYRILDTPPETPFDDCTQIAASLCATPIAFISFFDGNREWFKSTSGISIQEISREISLCNDIIEKNDLFVISESMSDARLVHLSAVMNIHPLRFYAAVPLVNRGGHTLGALCVVDTEPRILTTTQTDALKAFARQAMAYLELRRCEFERDTLAEEVRNAEKKTSAFFQTSLDCMITLNHEGHVLEWNPATERIFGHKADQAIGVHLAKLISLSSPQIDNQQCLNWFLEAEGTAQKIQYLELTAQAADGRIIPVELAVSSVYSHDQRIFTLCMRDITERRLDERSLRKVQEELESRVEERTAELKAANIALASEVSERSLLEQNYQNLFENAVEGIFQSSPEGVYLSANPALARMYGYQTPKDMLQSLESIGTQLYVKLERRAEFMRLIQDNDILTDFESEVYRRDGTTVWISETARAIRACDGSIIRYEGTVQDITGRKHAEKAMQESEERYRSLVEYCPEAIFVYSDYQFTYANPSGAALLGAVTSEDIIGRNILDFVHQDDLLAVRERIQNCKGSGGNEPYQNAVNTLRERKYVRLDGQIINVEVMVTPIHYQARKSALVWIRDITERKKAEVHIHTLNSELTHAYNATIEGWSRALDLRDHETEGHSRRVTELTLELARAVGMSPEDIVLIRWGAELHDIGKMGVPDGILLKPEPLSDEEWALMRRHPELARDMLMPIAFLSRALDIPYCHHEKWDGSGYPNGLRGEEIPLAARLFAIVDVWDALCSDRPYRKAWEREQVLDHIKSLSGTHFDPDLVSVFLHLMHCKEFHKTSYMRASETLPMAA